MVQIRLGVQVWLTFVMTAAIPGVCPAQDVASPDASELDMDLVKLKNGPRGKARESVRRLLLLVALKQKEMFLAASLEDAAAYLAEEIAFRRYIAALDLSSCPEDFRKVFRVYARKLNVFDETALKTVADFPMVDMEDVGRELFRVLLNYRLEPELMAQEMKFLVDEEMEGREDLSPEQMIAIVRELRENLASGKRPFPPERPMNELLPEG